MDIYYITSESKSNTYMYLHLCESKSNVSKSFCMRCHRIVTVNCFRLRISNAHLHKS